MNVICKIQNTDVTPINLPDLNIELNFDRDSPEARTTLNKFRFVGNEALIIYNIIQAGKTGGNGIFEGIPFTIYIQDTNTNITLFHYIDLTEELEFVDTDDITVLTKEIGKIDWLNDVADGFSFEYLYEIGVITNTDFVFVPYILNSVPNYKESIIAIIGVFFITTEIERAVNTIAQIVAESATFFDSVGAVIRGVIYVLYLITLLITLVKLISDLVDLLIQPVKYHAGMYVKTLFEKAAQHLGLGFNSSIFNTYPWNKMLLIPEKLNNPADSKDERILGFLSPSPGQQTGYYNGTFGDLVRAFKPMFNAKVITEKDNNTLRFERVDYYDNTGVYQIPSIESEEPIVYNTDEFNANYLIKFATDVNDKNTIQEYKGTVLQVTHRPITYTDEKLILMRNLERVDIPFALGKRKETLTAPEKIIKTFLQISGALLNALIVVVNALIKVINAIAKVIKVLKRVLNLIGIKFNPKIQPIKPLPKINFAQIVNDRIGMLVLENDIVNVPKLILINKRSNARETDLLQDNDTLLSARKLWEDFHVINSFVPSSNRPEGNQWITVSLKNVPFTLDDYSLIANNKAVKDPLGRNAEIISLKWNVWKQLAEITYRYNELYTKNIQLSYHEGEGR